MRIYENVGNTPTLRASFPAAAAGQIHTYQATYDTRTGQIAVWRAGGYLGSWTDPTPLTSGSYVSLRTDTADVSFDSLVVLSVVKYYYSGGQRIALRRDGSVYYLLTDQLGSTRVTTDETGAPRPADAIARNEFLSPRSQYPVSISTSPRSRATANAQRQK